MSKVSKVVFLGTGTSTGIPMIGCHCPVCTSEDPRDRRTRCSLYVEVNGVKIVIDTGPDFRQQMLREGLEDVDAVLFTHPHKDHMAGLDDIRPINYLRDKRIHVYAAPSMTPRLKQEYPYIFEGNYPGIPRIVLHEFTDAPFDVLGVEVMPVRAKHGEMEVFGFRMGDFTYLTDANSIPAASMERIRGSRHFVINAIHERPHYSHFNLKEALEVIRDIGPEHAWLTHLSHWMGRHAETASRLPVGVRIAFDGLQPDV